MAVLLYDELRDYPIQRLSLRVDRHVRLRRRLLSKASGVSEDHESTPRCAPDRADFGEFSELLERATQDLETVFLLFEERVEQRRQAPAVEASISRHSKGRTATLPEMPTPG